MAIIGKFVNYIQRNIIVRFNDSINYIRSCIEYYPPGIDSKPVSGDMLIVVSLNRQNNKVVVGVRRDLAERLAKEGEIRIYSKVSGANVHCRDDGTVAINGDAKSFMTFEDFASCWNNLIPWLSSHTHPYSSGNTGNPNQSIGTNISDISGAKTQTVKTNG